MADTTRPASPPRILQLVTHDKMGGVRTLVQMVESGLREQGFVVETLPLHSGGGGLSVAGDLARAAREILSARYDVIFTYQAAASVFGGFLGWLRGTPLRVVHHTAAPEGIRPHWKVLDLVFGWTGVYTHFISNSSATSASFQAWPAAYRRRFVLIPHGVDPIPKARGEIDWRGRLGIPKGALVLIATGRLVDQKNHAVAVEALPLLPAAHLVIAGDGPNRGALEEQAKAHGVSDRLHLLGAIDRLALGDVFAAGDIYVFPSVWETFGLAGVEAAMAGLPVVASDLPVLQEVLDIGGSDAPADSVMARFHSPHEPGEFARAVTAIADAYPDEGARAAFAERHRRRHSRERMLGLYREFLGRP